MTEYLVRAGTPEGAVVEQRHRSASAEALRREVEGRGLHVFSVQPTRARFRIPWLRHREKVTGMEFLVFNQQLATLLRAGIPVLQSLELLQRAQSGAFFREVLSRILDDVRSGVSLSEAFAAQGALFPRLYCTTIMSGERSGELVSVLERYIHHQKMIEAIRRRVSSALTYPVVLVLLALGLVTVLVTYVIPRFAEFYVGFAAELPLPTLIVLGMSHWIRQHLAWIVGAVAIGGFLVRRWMLSEHGSVAWDRMRLHIPFIGPVFHLFALSQFIRSLATLLAGGTPLVNALEVATSTVTNRAVSTPLARVAPRVREGQSLWSSLEATKIFPEVSTAMVQVGEATGALEEMLINVSTFYDEIVEAKLARLVSLIEPAVLVLMGGVIAGLLLSVYLPMFTLLQKAQ